MSRQKAQGTAFESALVKAAQAYGLDAARLPEGGAKDRGDVTIGSPYPNSSLDDIVAVAWKRLVKGNGQRRTPDGEPVIVAINLPDFLSLIEAAGADCIVECKATERLNITRTLAKARRKALQ